MKLTVFGSLRESVFWGACLTFVVVFFLLAGQSVSLASALNNSHLVFSDDFAENPLGAIPKDWRRTGPGVVEVIQDPQDALRKAVRVRVNSGDSSGTHLMGPLLKMPSSAPEAIVLDFLIWPLDGRSLNVYLSSGSGSNVKHHVNVYIANSGKLAYRGDRGVELASFKDGWNHVRIIANRTRNQAVVYLNDMETPLGDPMPFRTPADSWDNTYVYILHPRNAGNTGRSIEALYRDVNVWVLEEEQETIRRPERRSFWIGDKEPRPLPTLPIQRTSYSHETIPLTVAETLGISRGPQPVSSGIPFPEGHLWNPNEVRLVRSDGTYVPLQTTVLSRWSDGSIRWLLLDFQTELSAREQVELSLEYGSDVECMPCLNRDNGISVNEDSQTITVDTGNLEVTFGKRAPLIRSLKVDDERWPVSSPELVIQGVGGHAIDSSMAPYQLSIEEMGSERVVVRVQGELYEPDRTQELSFAYDIRIHFYRGGHVVRVDPTITNLMGTHLIQRGRTYLTNVSLNFPGWVVPGEKKFEFASEGGEMTSVISGSASSLELVQPDWNSFDVIADSKSVASGRRSAGWLHVEGSKQSVGIGVRHFWQQAPKKIDIDEKGNLTVHLWADKDHPLGIGGGEAKRHELILTFGDVGKTVLPGMLHPLRAVARPEWYSKTEAFGRPLFLVSQEQLPLYDPFVSYLEEAVEKGYTVLMENRDRYNEYGWRSFGDWSTDWDPDGWGNSEYDLAYVYFHQFARTGDLRYFELAEEAARHWMDVDMIWATNDIDVLGGGMSHTSEHRGYVGEHHTWNQGMIENYHLTGDRRSLEAAQAVGDFFAHLALVRPERHRPRLFQNPQRDVNPRSAGWALISLMAIYESTRDPYYLEAATTIVDFLELEQQEDGQWPYWIAANEIESRPVATKPFMTAIVLRGLGDYHRITKDQRAAHMLTKGLTFLIEELWDEQTRGYPYIDHPSQKPTASNTNVLLLDAFAYAYEITGDEKFVDFALKGLSAYAPQLVNQIYNRQNVGKIIAQSLRHTSHSLAALLEPRAYAFQGPVRLAIGREGEATGELTIIRYQTEDEFSGAVHVTGLPAGMTVAPDDLTFALGPGESFKTIPFRLQIDNRVAPGLHQGVFYDPSRDGLEVRIPIEVSGRTITDQFKPPIEDSFFGKISFTMAEEMTPGWVYDVGTPIQFFGDADRMMLSDSGQEHLTYDVPGLFNFELTLYVPVDEVEKFADHVQAFVSNGGDTWEAVDTVVVWEIREGVKHARGIMKPEDAYLRGDVKLKIVATSDSDVTHIQIGRLDIRTRE